MHRLVCCACERPSARSADSKPGAAAEDCQHGCGVTEEKQTPRAYIQVAAVVIAVLTCGGVWVRLCVTCMRRHSAFDLEPVVGFTHSDAVENRMFRASRC